MRGLIPSAWTSISPPPSVELISGGCLGNDGLGDGCLGTGTASEPLVVFGDASGGRDTLDSRLRR
eukprot:8171672-Pyramimonas_sp.AAC.1